MIGAIQGESVKCTGQADAATATAGGFDDILKQCEQAVESGSADHAVTSRGTGGAAVDQEGAADIPADNEPKREKDQAVEITAREQVAAVPVLIPTVTDVPRCEELAGVCLAQVSSADDVSNSPMLMTQVAAGAAQALEALARAAVAKDPAERSFPAGGGDAAAEAAAEVVASQPSYEPQELGPASEQEFTTPVPVHAKSAPEKIANDATADGPGQAAVAVKPDASAPQPGLAGESVTLRHSVALAPRLHTGEDARATPVAPRLHTGEDARATPADGETDGISRAPRVAKAATQSAEARLDETRGAAERSAGNGVSAISTEAHAAAQPDPRGQHETADRAIEPVFVASSTAAPQDDATHPDAMRTEAQSPSASSGGDPTPEVQDTTRLPSTHWIKRVDGETLQLGLRTELFGRVEVAARVQGDQVHADVRVADPAIGPLLNAEVPQLGRALEAQGMQLGSFSFAHSAAMNSGGGEHQPGQQHTRPQQQAYTPVSLEPAAPAAYDEPAVQFARRIDLHA